MGPLIVSLFFIAMGLWSFTRIPEPRNSYESFKRDSGRVVGVVFLLIVIVAGSYTVEQLVKPDKPPLVHQVITSTGSQ